MTQQIQVLFKPTRSKEIGRTGEAMGLDEIEIPAVPANYNNLHIIHIRGLNDKV